MSVYALGLDFETTGLDTKECRVIEVGVALARVSDWQIGMASGWLVKQPSLLMTDEIRHITHIDNEIMDKFGYQELGVFKKLNQIMEEVDYVIAYNGRDYDQAVYLNHCERLGLEPVKKLWIDPLKDIEWPQHVHGRKLVHVAAEHGFVNPFPHRALFDVVTMLKVCSFYKIEDLVTMAKAPEIELEAIVSYNDKELAKVAGYKWQPENKSWIKLVKAINGRVEAEYAVAKEAGFKIRENTRV